MSLIERVDLWLLERTYQWVVDVSQRKPAWWVEQCAYAFLVFGLADVMASPGPTWLRYVLALIVMLGALAMWGDAKFPELMASTARAVAVRRRTLVTVSMLTPFVFLREAFWLPGVAFGLALVSSYYFAACKPPRPRDPKTKLAPRAA